MDIDMEQAGLEIYLKSGSGFEVNLRTGFANIAYFPYDGYKTLAFRRPL